MLVLVFVLIHEKRQEIRARVFEIQLAGVGRIIHQVEIQPRVPRPHIQSGLVTGVVSCYQVDGISGFIPLAASLSFPIRDGLRCAGRHRNR